MPRHAPTASSPWKRVRERETEKPSAAFLLRAESLSLTAFCLPFGGLLPSFWRPFAFPAVDLSPSVRARPRRGPPLFQGEESGKAPHTLAPQPADRGEIHLHAPPRADRRPVLDGHDHEKQGADNAPKVERCERYAAELPPARRHGLWPGLPENDSRLLGLWILPGRGG